MNSRLRFRRKANTKEYRNFSLTFRPHEGMLKADQFVALSRWAVITAASGIGGCVPRSLTYGHGIERQPFRQAMAIPPGRGNQGGSVSWKFASKPMRSRSSQAGRLAVTAVGTEK